MYFKISQNSQEKHLWLSLFINKVAGLKPVALLKKDPSTVVFTCEYYEIIQNTYFEEHMRAAVSDVSKGGTITKNSE